MGAVRRASWGMLHADDASNVSSSLRVLERMLAIFGVFGPTISESRAETMYITFPRAPATQIVFNATGQQHRQTTFLTFWEAPSLKPESGRPRLTGESLRGG